MSKTVLVTVGVLGVGVVALAVYVETRPDVVHEQQTAVVDQQRAKLRAQQSAAPQNSTPPPPSTEQAAVAPSSPPPAAESAPVHHNRARKRATQHYMPQAHSSIVQELSSQATERTAFSEAENNPRKLSSSTAAPQNNSQALNAGLQPRTSSPLPIASPASPEQHPQPPDSNSDVLKQKDPAAVTAALQLPLSPSPASASVQAVVAPFAMLHATGKILLNGILSDDSVIVSGESIETPPDTYATVVREKSEVLIKPGSKLRITERGVELERGQVQVTTTTTMTVQADRLTIAPRGDGPAKYEVLDIAGSTRVLTHEGSVLVKEGNPVPQVN